MPVITLAIAVALGIVLMLRKARFHYERLPKVPYVAGAQLPDISVIPSPRANRDELEASFPEDIIVPDGPQSVPSEWLLFVGEETRYARVFLPSLTQYALEEELDMISVFLKQEPAGFLDKLLTPYTMALNFTGVNSSRVNGRAPGEWLASGHCLLIERKAYDRLGSPAHWNDTSIPKLAAGKGIRSRVVRAEHLGTAYGALAGLRACVAGFRRLNPFSTLQTALAALLLLLWLPVLALLILGAYYRQAALFALLPTVVLFPWYRSATALLAPVAIYLFPIFAVNALKSEPAARESHAAGKKSNEAN